MASWPRGTASDDDVVRVRAALAGRPGLSEKAMFGGICFLLAGNMLCGARQGRFMFRVGQAAAAETARLPGASPMVHGNRIMRGFYWVDAAACDAGALERWLALAEAYVGAMPAKAAKVRKRKPPPLPGRKRPARRSGERG